MTREPLLSIFSAALKAADPYGAVLKTLRIDGDTLVCGDKEYGFDDIVVVGAGKATASMAAAVEETLAERIGRGMVIVKHGHTRGLTRINEIEASHPLPDASGARGTADLLDMLDGADAGTLVICLISGGASALLVAPAEGITLEEKRLTTDLLLRAGADIYELNAVRKHLSRVKGGRLAKAAYPARLLTLIISDVVGDRLDTIASGPTVPDPTTYADAMKVIEKYSLRDRLPENVMRVLTEGLEGKRPETPKGTEVFFEGTENLIVGNLEGALGAAGRKAEDLGFDTRLLSPPLEGEAVDAARYLARTALKAGATSGAPGEMPVCLLSGGETIVKVTGTGRGGRNQELALAFAIEIDGATGITMLSAGTDGTDGPTDAAGAIVDGATMAEAARLGIHAREYLKNNDSYGFFEKLDKKSGGKHHLKTGPTGTNVMDMQIIIVEGGSA